MSGSGETLWDVSPFPPQRVRWPVIRQSWERLTFLDWRYSPEAVAGVLPDGLEPDTLEGEAWIGLTPFIARVRPPAGCGALTFPETDVRTYVRGPDGARGVWFFSLEAASVLAVAGARLFYRLPYTWSRMRVDADAAIIRYESTRKWPHAGPVLRLAISPGEESSEGELGTLDHFLTTRFRLYTMLRRGLAYAQVERAPWRLRRARVQSLEESLLAAAGIGAPRDDPLVHYSPGVEVRIGKPVLLKPRPSSAAR